MPLIGFGVWNGLFGVCTWSAAAMFAWASVAHSFVLLFVGGCSRKQCVVAVGFAIFITCFTVSQWASRGVSVHSAS
jgi:hypothetical protein